VHAKWFDYSRHRTYEVGRFEPDDGKMWDLCCDPRYDVSCFDD